MLKISFRERLERILDFFEENNWIPYFEDSQLVVIDPRGKKWSYDRLDYLKQRFVFLFEEQKTAKEVLDLYSFFHKRYPGELFPQETIINPSIKEIYWKSMN